MDYLNARWFLVKDLSPEKLNALHRFERSVFKRARVCAASYKENKVAPPLWWQNGISFLGRERAGFWDLCARRENLTEINFFALRVRGALTAAGLNPAGLFNDIGLMHGCDLLVRKLPYITARTSLPYNLFTSSCKAPA